MNGDKTSRTEIRLCLQTSRTEIGLFYWGMNDLFFSWPGAHKTKHYTIYITTFTDYKTIAATGRGYRVNTVNIQDGGLGEGDLKLYFLRDDIFKQT